MFNVFSEERFLYKVSPNTSKRINITFSPEIDSENESHETDFSLEIKLTDEKPTIFNISKFPYLDFGTNASEKTAKLTGCDYDVKRLTIPSKFIQNGEVYTVTSVQAILMSMDIQLTYLYIPKTITDIGSSFDEQQDSLQQIIVEEGKPVFYSKDNKVYNRSTNEVVLSANGGN